MMNEQTDGNKWGDPIESIDEARREQLMRLEDKQQEWAEQPISERGESPFSHEDLTGAEVFFLATYTWFDTPDKMGIAEQRLRDNVVRPNSRLHLEGAHMNGAVLNGAILVGAHLDGADLSSAYLADSNLGIAKLTGANLNHADLTGAVFEDADLSDANLGNVNLTDAKLLAATLHHAMLLNANLRGTKLFYADLSNADLRGTRMNGDTSLDGCKVAGASFDQATFGGVKLTLIEWEAVDILGDERKARERRNEAGGTKSSTSHLYEFQAAARAYRQLSVALQAQGRSDYASHFEKRAKIMQREVLRYQNKRVRYLIYLLLDWTSGYGYSFPRIFGTYSGVLALFAILYFVAGQIVGTPLSIPDSILVSFTAVHGRVFLGQFGLHSLLSWIAGIEAAVGIVIEGIFIAMLIQWFYSR